MRYGVVVMLFASLVGCGELDESEIVELTEDDTTTEKSTNRPRVSHQFNAQHVISDAFYGDVDALDEAGVQAFLEDSPYGRSWLASARTESGSPVSRSVVFLAKTYSINPILLLSRMQVESSLVSAGQRPANHLVDYAMGCGCHDGTNCAYAPRGLGPQLECAAQKFRQLYEKSRDGSGWWRKSLPKDTLDYYRIVPQSHATAALYAYTPWVLPNRGGTWLAWSIASQFDKHITNRGFDGISGTVSDGDSDSNLGTAVTGTQSNGSDIYVVSAGGTCWEAGVDLGCPEGVVVCNTTRTCQTLQVGDRIACSLDACSGTVTAETEVVTPSSTQEADACEHFVMPAGGACEGASRALGCGVGGLVNCTEPSAGCHDVWEADVFACDTRCCPGR